MAAISCQPIFSMCSRLLARAIAACRPSSSLQSIQQVAVTVRNKNQSAVDRQIIITSEHMQHAASKICFGSYISRSLPLSWLAVPSLQVEKGGCDAVSDTGKALPDDVKVIAFTVPVHMPVCV